MKTQIINKITEDLSDSVSDTVSKEVTEKTFWRRKKIDNMVMKYAYTFWQ